MNDVRKIIVPVLLVVVAIIAGMWFMTRERAGQTEEGPLSGSGAVEAVQVIVSPELAGRVVEVLVAEGDAVQAGDVLFRLDDALLAAQRTQAQVGLEAARAGVEVAETSLAATLAAIATAQAQYDLEAAAARQQAQPARAAEWNQDAPDEFILPLWYFTGAEERGAALAEVDAAAKALESQQASLAALLAEPGSAEVLAAEERLVQAQAAFWVASDVLTLAEANGSQALKDYAQQDYDVALAELEAAQDAYERLLTTSEAEELLEQRAQLALAQERYQTAQDRYNALLTGEDSLRVQAAAASLAQAQANRASAEAKVTQAEAAVAQAQAQLDIIDVQIGKTTIYAASNGVVLTRSIEPGEVVQPGAIALVIGQLDHLTLTVYLPEDRYGQVQLGGRADVTVDSFPNVTFAATVTRIADEAEFTPRNVQTEESRRTTVFAVTLTLDDSQGRLKPGMPADVVFDE